MYSLKHYKRFTCCIAGFPNAGKTLFALAPHEFLGDIAYVPFDQGAEQLEGVPKAFSEGRVKIYRPGWSESGIRLKGPRFTSSILDWCSNRRKERTVIFDTISAMTRFRFYDALELGEGGTPGVMSKYHKENEPAQHLAVAALDTLYNTNPELNIVFLHHLKKLNKPGEEMELETMTPDVTGSKLLPIWPGQFSVCVECAVEAKASSTEFHVRLSPTNLNKTIRIRTGIGHPIAKSHDVTIKDLNDISPMINAWDKIFIALDSSQE